MAGDEVHEQDDDPRLRRLVAELVDATTRNPLLRHDRTAHLRVDPSAAGALVDRLLAGEAVPIGAVPAMTSADHGDVLRTARDLTRRARDHLFDQGVHTLHLGVGLLTWERGDVPPSAPLLLLPIRLLPVGSWVDATIEPGGDLALNGLVADLLQREHGLELPPVGDRPGGVTSDLVAIGEVVAGLPGVAIDPSGVVANFSFAGVALRDDLVGSWATFEQHPITAALLDEEQRPGIAVATERPADLVLGSEADLTCLPADHSQLDVVRRAAAGEHLVIEGPPGTGKSQTIANLVCQLVGSGRTVLFVAEKAAAIRAVRSRLEAVGLGPVIADLHGTERPLADLRRSVGAGLERVQASDLAADADDDPALSGRLLAVLGAASEHLVAPTVGEPSVADLVDDLAAELLDGDELLDVPAEVGLDRSALLTLDEPAFDGVCRQLAEVLSSVGDATGSAADGVTVLGDDLLDRLAGAAAASVDDVVRRVEAVARQLPTVSTIDLDVGGRILAAAADAARLDGLVDVTADPAVLAADAELLATASPLDRAGPAGRAAQDRLRAALRLPDAGSLVLVDQGRSATTGLATLATRLDGATLTPALAAELVGLARVPAAVELASLLAAVAGAVGSDRPLAWLGEVVRWAQSSDGARRQEGRRRELEEALRVAGAGGVLDLARQRELTPDRAVRFLRIARLRGILRQRVDAERLGDRVDPAHLTALADDLRRLDAAHLERNPARVLAGWRRAATATLEAHPDQLVTLRAELHRRQPQLSGRSLVAAAPDVVPALVPCLALSPTLVAQLLPSLPGLFDVVVFDEASQVTPAAALGSLLRGGQVIVAGDPRQLPPTTFFRGAVDEPVGEGGADDAGDLLAGFESVLDVLRSLVTSVRLTWHYRSEDDRLIAFSNQRFYGGAMVTFPAAARGASPLRLVQTTSVDAEITAVVDHVLEHARLRPEESLGVIALGLGHAQTIRAELDRRLDDPSVPSSMAAWCDAEHPEALFIRNLEQVQGDERDHIVLSVGYGPGDDGQLRYHFGPIVQQGGDRRLNVAATRARRAMTVVAAFGPEQLDRGAGSSAGLGALRDLLRVARGESVTSPPGGRGRSTSQWLAAELRGAGLEAAASVGGGARPVDVAIAAGSGSWDLAVDVEDAHDPAGWTARDRLTLRREALERRGWRCRTVSTVALALDPGAVVARLVADAASPGDRHDGSR